MRNTITTILLAALAGNAVAGWTVTDKGDTQTAYADIDSIRSSANTVKMWTLMDFATPQWIGKDKSYSSTVMLYEFDCSEQRARVLQAASYLGRMREGTQVISANSPWEWEYAQPDTVKDMWLKMACKKK